MTRYIIGGLLVLAGIWILRHVRVGRKLPKSKVQQLETFLKKHPAPKPRQRFDGEPNRHEIRRRAPLRKVS